MTNKQLATKSVGSRMRLELKNPYSYHFCKKEDFSESHPYIDNVYKSNHSFSTIDAALQASSYILWDLFHKEEEFRLASTNKITRMEYDTNGTIKIGIVERRYCKVIVKTTIDPNQDGSFNVIAHIIVKAA